MRIIDLAEAHGARAAEHKIVGIRPGEKLHEVMVTEDDARTTVELRRPLRHRAGVPLVEPRLVRRRRRHARCADGFRYASDTNARVARARDGLHEPCSTASRD